MNAPAWLLALGLWYSGEKPAALIALEEARSSLCAERVEWSVVTSDAAGRPLRFVSRYARNGDWSVEHRGDPDGYTVFEPASGEGISKYPQVYLQNGDGAWYWQESDPDCDFWPRNSANPSASPDPDARKEVRFTGIAPSPWSMKSDVGFRAVWNDPRNAIVRWRESRRGDVFIVVGECENGAEFTWEINSAKGWNCERVAFEHEGVVIQESVSSLRKYGDTWFPEATHYFFKGELIQSVRVTNATLGARAAPARLTLADLGVEAGTNITYKDRTLPIGDTRVWNGEAEAPIDVFYAEVHAGKRKQGPTWERRNRGETIVSPYATAEQKRQPQISAVQIDMEAIAGRHVPFWLRYVREFIQRHELNGEQEQTAMAVLSRCEQSADKAIEPKGDQLRKLVGQRREAIRQNDAVRRTELREEIERILEPVNRIFETELKPRLDQIPTREQRKAAAAQAAPGSQPLRP
ncbi:MAG: hypothetical protein U1D55_12325 [Phycisphaerae bacterium]